MTCSAADWLPSRKRRGAGRRLTLRFVAAILAVVTMAGGLTLVRVDTAVAQTEPVLTTMLPLNDPIVGSDIWGLNSQQYHQNNQRNFWWNAAAGRWDAFLPTASPPAGARSEWWLWHDVGGTPTPKQLAENSGTRTPDAYWDAGSLTLYVFFSVGNSGTSRFHRYLYNPGRDTYDRSTPPGGVTPPQALRGGPRVTIIKSPNGMLWAGVNHNGSIQISRSTDGGNTWPTPAVIKSTAIQGEGHWVTFTVGGKTHVGFAATEDGLAPGGNPMVHFVHLDQDEVNWTNPSRWTDESSQLPPWEGAERADDELSAVVFDNRVFIVIETEPLGNARAQRAPQLIVFERAAGGGWEKHIILRYTGAGADDAKRPVITVEAASRLLVVSGGSTARTHADVWYAPIDDLTSRDEQWSKVRSFQVTNPATENIYTTRIPLPRFPVGADANLLLMIDDRGDALRMWRQLLRPGGAIGNSPPVINSVTVTPSAPKTNDTLTATVSATDPDGDTLTYQYQWIKNGLDIPGATNATLDLSAPGNGDRGDSISVRVVASDGELSSTPVTSAAVTVVNSAPVISSVTIDQSTPKTNDTLTATVAASDPDGDALTYQYQWIKNGTDLAGATSASLNLATSGNGDRGDTIALRVVAFDGTAPSPPATWPAVVAVGSPYNTAGTRQTVHDIDLPDGTEAGDLLVVVFPYDGGGGANWPAGWTRILDRPNGSHGLAVAYRIATGSEGSTVAVTTSARQAVGFSYRISDWNPAQAPEIASATGHNTTPDPPNLAPSWGSADTLWIAAYGINGGTSNGGPTFPLTDNRLYARTGGSAASGGAVASQVIAGGSLNPNPFSDSINSEWVAATIAIRPTAAASQPKGSTPVTSPSVTVVNSVPVFNQDLTDRSDAEGAVISLSAAATDADGDTLTYSATNLPAGLSINASTGLIGGTIAAGAATSSPYAVTITVNDGTGPVNDTFTWTVTAAGLAPAAPTGLAAKVTSTDVRLTWAPNSEPGLAGYRVYRGSSPSGPFTALNTALLSSPAFNDTTAPMGLSHYRVTAVGVGDQESVPAQTAATRRIGLVGFSQSSARGNSVTVARPAGTATGDLLLASVALNGSGTINVPSGWTLARGDVNGSVQQAILYRFVQPQGEPASTTFSFGSNTSAAAAITAYRGAATVGTVDAASGASSMATSWIDASNVTTTAAGTLLVGAFGVASNATITAPAEMVGRSYVLQNAGNAKIGVSVADEILATAGATGPRSAALPGSGGRGAAAIGQLVAILPG